MTRNPYDAHLCAQNPHAFRVGFEDGCHVAAMLDRSGEARPVYEAIRDSDGVPFPETAAKVELEPTPWAEGFMLAIYAHVALSELP